MEGEAIMICIDTCKWMAGDNSHMWKEQADAIKLYCTEKFKSHPETVIGICGMSDITHFAEPDNDIWKIMRALNEVSLGGYLMLLEAVVNAYDVWFGCRGKELGVHLPKRIVVFAGGPVYDEIDKVQILGKGMKDKNVACDAISFGDPARNKKKLFETLIAAADNNGNCNHLHVPPNSSVLHALSSSQIIRSGSAPFASLPVQPKQNINALSSSPIMGSGSAPLAGLPVQQESSKQNINGVPRYLYLRRGSAPYAILPGEPKSSKENINALSSSQIMGSGSAPLASLPVQQPESSKHDVMAPALYSVADNTDALSRSQIIPHVGGSSPLAIKVLSRSLVDLKLVNVKPNSQPETLGERIKRLKQEESESLLKQKKKQGRNEQKNKQVAC